MQKAQIITAEEALKLNANVTFLTGVFDLLHPGHMRMLANAKQINPDAVLMVGVLSDENVKERKGDARPIFNLEERCEALSYLRSVDYVVPWKTHWSELRDFIGKLKPAVLAVVEGDGGIDDKRAHIEKAGGKLVILKKEGDYSTTSIIEKAKLV